MRFLYASSALILAACSGASRTAPVNASANTAATENRMDIAVARIPSAMSQAMGGAEAWEKARYLEFDFVVVRQGREAARWSHRWDRWRGDYRLSGVRGGDTIVAVFNVNDPRARSSTVQVD